MSRQSQGMISVIGRFLFSPTDPTALGFIRILTGILILYSTFAYSFDLQWLMGKDAWWSQDHANRARREAPYIVYPLGWQVFEPAVKLEDSPHRRAALIEFMMNLPESVEERKQKLQFLATISEMTYENQQASIFLPNSVARVVTERELEDARKALMQENIKKVDSPVQFPPFVSVMTIPERLKFWDDVLAFTNLLPADPRKQEYVLSWISFYPFELRKNLIRYLAGDYINESGQQLGLPAKLDIRKEYLNYYEYWGYDPRQHTKNTPLFSAYYHVSETESLWFVHLTVMLATLFFIVGLYTRVSAVLVYIGTLSYIHRSSHHMFGQDTMQTILLLYLTISPSAAAFSIDALRQRYRASKALLAANGKSVPWAERVLSGPQPSWLANFAIRMIQMHFAIIYLVSGASKLKGNAWWNHNSGWLTLANPDFGLMNFPFFETMLHTLADYRVLTMIISGGIVFFTVGLEFGFIFLVWTRARPILLAWAFLFHVGIVMFMGLCVFGMYMYTMMMSYFPSKLIRAKMGLAPNTGEKLTVTYNPSNSAHTRRVAIMVALDLNLQVKMVADSKAEHLRVVSQSGRTVSGNSILGKTLIDLALLKPLAGCLRLLGSGTATNDVSPPANRMMAVGMFVGGLALKLVGIYGAVLTYAGSQSFAGTVPFIIAAGLGLCLKLVAIRQMLFKGAI